MTRVDDTLYAVRGKIWIAVKGRRARDLGNEWVVWVREGKITANSLEFVVFYNSKASASCTTGRLLSSLLAT